LEASTRYWYTPILVIPNKQEIDGSTIKLGEITSHIQKLTIAYELG